MTGVKSCEFAAGNLCGLDSSPSPKQASTVLAGNKRAMSEGHRAHGTYGQTGRFIREIFSGTVRPLLLPFEPVSYSLFILIYILANPCWTGSGFRVGTCGPEVKKLYLETCVKP